MLGVGAAVTIPAVIGNVHKNLRALLHGLADLIWKDGFVANENSELCISSLQGHAGSATRKVAYIIGESSSKEEQPAKRNIFSERDKMNFVIARDQVRLRIKQRARVVSRRRHLVGMHGIALAQAPNQYPSIRLFRNIAQRIAKYRVVGIKRRRRLRPHNQAGTLPVLSRLQADRGQIAKVPSR